MNESNADVFINELAECHELGLGKGVHGTNRRGSTFLQVDLQIVRAMQGQRISLSFAEDIGIVVVLFRNVGEVRDFIGDGSRMSGDGGILKLCAPGSLQARMKAAAPIREMCRAEAEGFGEAEFCGGS